MAQAYLGNTSLGNLYLGSTQINNTPSYYNTPNITILNAVTSFDESPLIPTKADLESKLTGENITYFVNTLNSDVYATSISNATVTASAFENSFITFFSSPIITELNVYSFAFCPSMSVIDLPNLVTINGSQTFINNDALTNVNFPKLEIMGTGTFQGSEGLISASFALLESFGPSCFSGCTSLNWLYVPSLSGSNAIGGSSDANGCFLDVANSGSITVPSFYQTNNAGNLDGDLAYLVTKGWAITWV